VIYLLVDKNRNNTDLIEKKNMNYTKKLRNWLVLFCALLIDLQILQLVLLPKFNLLFDVETDVIWILKMGEKWINGVLHAF
jgi:hypothetical protein